jgi:outer membrane protein assembly factor BamB
MKTSELVFVGIKGSVVALNRATGAQAWATHLKGSDFVNVVLQDGALLAATHGELFRLDPLTGIGMWHNPLKGFGTGLTSIAMGQASNMSALAEQNRQDIQTAAAACGVAASASCT